MILMGIGMTVSGVIGVFTVSVESGIPACVTFVVGLCIMIYGQIKYNHGIF